MPKRDLRTDSNGHSTRDHPMPAAAGGTQTHTYIHKLVIALAVAGTTTHLSLFNCHRFMSYELDTQTILELTR